jgi:hypothetical protein
MPESRNADALGHGPLASPASVRKQMERRKHEKSSGCLDLRAVLSFTLPANRLNCDDEGSSIITGAFGGL